MTKVLVTGAAGLIGSWLVNYLIEKGHEVVAVDNLTGGKRAYVHPKADFYLGDLRSQFTCKTIITSRKPEVIFHLAAHACEGQSVFNPAYTVESNLIGFLNLFTSALNVGFETFVFTSSMAAYGNQEIEYALAGHYHTSGDTTNYEVDLSRKGFAEDLPRQPVDPYGMTKANIERYLELYSKEFGFNYVVFRPHNVYGPRQNLADPYRNVLGIWMNRIMNGKAPVIYGDGEQTRAFSYVEDSTAYIAESAWSEQAYGEIFNIGSDEVVTVNQACQTVMDAMGFKGDPIHAPERPLEVKHAWCSQEKAKRILSFKSKTSLKDGVAKMASWAKTVGPQPFNYWDWDMFEIKKKVPKVWKEKQL